MSEFKPGYQDEMENILGELHSLREDCKIHAREKAELKAYLRTLADFGGTLQQARELAAKALEPTEAEKKMEAFFKTVTIKGAHQEERATLKQALARLEHHDPSYVDHEVTISETVGIISAALAASKQGGAA